MRGWGVGGLRDVVTDNGQKLVADGGEGAVVDGLSLFVVCNNKLLDLERKFQTHLQPLLSAAPPHPSFPMPEKLY